LFFKIWFPSNMIPSENPLKKGVHGC
jgi:hypothetical protein